MSLQEHMKTQHISTSRCSSLKRFSTEEVFCAICRVRFCCARDRGAHEDAEHSAEAILAARHHLQMLKETKPLICTVCCQVFMSGIFVNDICKTLSQSLGTVKKRTKVAHTLICIPEWAVKKHLLQDQRKRSWEKANAEVDIVIEPANEDPQNSLIVQKNLQSILTKQRKADLSDRPSRRVTFSPVTAVAFTNRFSTFASKITSGLVDEPLSKGTPDLNVPTATATTTTTTSDETPAPPQPNTSVPITSPEEIKPDCGVFSPPLSDGNNSSTVMYPQMASTPYSETEDRWDTPQCNSSSPSLKAEPLVEPTLTASVFSSIANTICGALQALPSVVFQLFSLGNHEEQSKQEKLPHRRRRRSSSYAPYIPLPKRIRSKDRERGCVRRNARSEHPTSKVLSFSPLESR